MLLQQTIQHAIGAIFGLGEDFIRSGTYIRPMSFSSQTGLSAATEVQAAVKFIAGKPRFPEFDLPASSYELVHIRASELGGITNPAAGDYILETTSNLRRDVLRAELDDSGQIWTFRTIRLPNEDWGDFVPHSLSEDYNLITSNPTTYSDYLTL